MKSRRGSLQECPLLSAQEREPGLSLSPLKDVGVAMAWVMEKLIPLLLLF